MELILTGGARVGGANVTWPFAKLRCDGATLVLESGISGTFSFSPEDVYELHPFTMIPFLGRGIQIMHSVADYNERLIFWAFDDPKQTIERIKAIGFVPSGDPAVRTTRSAYMNEGGMPFKWTFIIGTVVLWNILFAIEILPMISGIASGKPSGRPIPGPGMLAALAVMAAICLTLLVLPAAQRIALKPGRSIDGVRPLLAFVAFICLAILFLGTIGST